MITVRYQGGRVEKRAYAVISGDKPIGIGRPLPDDCVLDIMDGWISVTMVGGSDEGTIVWSRDKVTELDLGPIAEEEEVILREGEDIPF